jgi:hypothetical protein
MSRLELFVTAMVINGSTGETLLPAALGRADITSSAHMAEASISLRSQCLRRACLAKSFISDLLMLETLDFMIAVFASA